MAGSNVNFNLKVFCKNCTEDIFAIHTVLIRCAVCPNLDLCPDCFAAGAVLGSHTKTHAYTVIDNGGFGLLKSSWSAKEHIDLLDCVEQYGYGNWEDVAKRLKTYNPQRVPRTPGEIKEEFSTVFIKGPIGRRTWNEAERGKTKDHTPSKVVTQTHQATDNGNVASSLSLDELIMLGHMPLRDDYEVEYDNDAELLVAKIQNFPPGSSYTGGIEDEEVDKDLQASQVQMYRLKLEEREKRKKVIKEHQLVNLFFKENPLPFSDSGSRNFGSKTVKRSFEAPKTDMTERLKTFAKFQKMDEHQQFMANILKEKELKARVKELLRFRKNGITQLRDSTDYEIQRLRRLKRKNELKRRQQGFMDTGAIDSPSNSSFKATEETLASSLLGSPISSALSPSKNPADDKLNSIIGLPGYELLSANERRLCSSLKLTPAHYISYKTCLLTNHLQKKKGQTPKPLNPEGLDKNNRKIILQFLIRAGWITAY